MNRIYLDYAAATPIHTAVLERMLPFYSKNFFNPSSLYQRSVAVKAALDQARSEVARLIGAKSSEIIFTAGGTESANLAIRGVMEQHKGARILVSTIEHKAVYETAKLYDSADIKVHADASVDLASLRDALDTRTVLVCVMLVNNEVGTIQPLEEVAAILKAERDKRRAAGNDLPLYLYVDACQAPLFTDVHVTKLGADLLTLNGGKMHGPKQSGILFVRAGVVLKPLIYGGGQELGMRSGTENIAHAIGFAEALSRAAQGRVERRNEVTALRDWFMTELETRFGAVITGSRKKRIANNIHALFKAVDNERVLFALDDMGIEVGIGSACSASSVEASHVLLAMGYTTKEARSSIRFSLGSATTKQELDRVLDSLPRALSA